MYSISILKNMMLKAQIWSLRTNNKVMELRVFKRRQENLVSFVNKHVWDFLLIFFTFLYLYITYLLNFLNLFRTSFPAIWKRNPFSKKRQFWMILVLKTFTLALDFYWIFYNYLNSTSHIYKKYIIWSKIYF